MQSQEHSFYGLGIAPKLLEALDRLKFAVPTPIQRSAIPVAIEGKDVIGIAQTGTGKTLAFGIPMIQRLAQVKGRGLIILPTRELALQVDESLHKIGKVAGLRTAILIGGASMHRQLQMLKANPHVIIGTPGRIIDHLQQKSLRLDDVKILILDEADRMLDMGFAPQINQILRAVPRERQTMLFSATMPDDIVRIATSHMKMPVRVEIARAGSVTEKVQQELFIVRKEDKLRLLEKLLEQYRGTVLVFTRTKFGAKKIARIVRSMGHSAADIHSDRTLAQRRDALEGFKSGKYRVLIATDIAARGIDVKGIELVVNHDIPENPEDYVHRIGRTGRAGQEGKAITFAMPDQGGEVRAIERLARIHLPSSPLPQLPPARALPQLPHAAERPPRHYRSAPPRGGHRGGHAGGSSRPAREFPRRPARRGAMPPQRGGFVRPDSEDDGPQTPTVRPPGYRGFGGK